MAVSAAARDGSALGRVGRDGDEVAVLAEVGCVLCGTRDGDFTRVVVHAVAPADEGIARGGRSREVDCGTMAVSAAACDGSAFGRVGRNCDCIAVLAEVGDERPRPGHREAVVRTGGDHVAVHGPVGEGVSLIGRCRESDVLSMVVSAAACDGSAFGRVGRGSDHVAVEREVGRVST